VTFISKKKSPPHGQGRFSSQGKVDKARQVPVVDTGPGLAVLQPEAYLSKSMVNHLNNEKAYSSNLVVALSCIFQPGV
jgi:hypothetical protein